VNASLFGELRTKWGANVVRLAMYTQEYGGYCSGGNKKELRKLVVRGARLARKKNLYCIVDWHILSDGNPLTHVKEANSFFKKVSKSLGDTDHVIFEICNEPNGGTTWAQIRKYAKQVIPVIRKNDPDAIILVGTPTWSQEIDKALKKPLSYKNVMYTLHFYAGTHGSWLRDKAQLALNAGLPLLVSEFGACDASGNGWVNEGEATAWINWLAARNTGFVCWNLSNKWESSALINGNCGKLSGWNDADLSQQGRWYKATLQRL
jgi:endoglucanase